MYNLRVSSPAPDGYARFVLHASRIVVVGWVSSSLGLRLKSYGAPHSSIAVSIGQSAPLPSGVTDADGDGAAG